MKNNIYLFFKINKMDLTWYKKNDPKLNSPAYVGMSSTGKYITIAVYGDNIYISSDYGATFTNPIGNTQQKEYTGGLYVSDDGKVQTIPMIAANYKSGETSVIMSNDYGKTWNYSDIKYITTFPYPSLIQFSFIGGNNDGTIQFISTVYYGVYYYKNLLWYDTDLRKSDQWSSVCTVQYNNLLYAFVLSNTDQSIYYSTNNCNFFKINNISKFDESQYFLYMMIKNSVITVISSSGKIYTSKITYDDINASCYIDPFTLYNSKYPEIYDISMSGNGMYQMICRKNPPSIITSNDYGKTWIENTNIKFTPSKSLINDVGDFSLALSPTNLYLSKSNIVYNNEISLFMRGNNFTLNEEFYLVGRSQNSNTYYYLTINSDNNFIFISLPYEDLIEYNFPKISLIKN